MAAVLPAYGRHSLAEVFPAVLGALGVPDAAGGDLVLPEARAVVVLLVDGLGAELLREHAADAPFLAALPDAGPLTVGYPSSTSISLASLGTGLPPGAHGLLGITFRVPSGDLLHSLPWLVAGERGRLVDAREIAVPEEIQAAPTQLERAAAAGIETSVVWKHEFRGSGLTRAVLRGGDYRGPLAIGDLLAEVLTAVRRPGRQLCYGYHSDLDLLGHAYGPGSLAWRLQLAQVDRIVATIAEQLPPDTLLLVTGDHGMVHMGRAVDADADEDLQAGVLEIGGDPRARHVYCEPGAAYDVRAAWKSVLGEDAWVLSREQAIEEGWFGPVAAHLADRIGDVVVAMRGTAAVIRTRGEPVLSRLPGQHGSLTAAEQLVPLKLARGE